MTFRLKYVNEHSAWKLIGIKVDVKPAGATDVKLPSDDEMKALVRESLLAFNKAVQAKSFVAFHKSIAGVWQKQITPAKLRELFQSFIDAEIDIAPIAKLEPTFTAGPTIDEDGVLSVEGSYPTKPSQVHFKLAYIYEAPQWKLVKVNVRVKNEGENSDE